MRKIHKAGVLHEDIYPSNLLLVRGDINDDGANCDDRLVWIDFDVATTFPELGPEQCEACKNEILLVEGFRELLVRVLLATVHSCLQGKKKRERKKERKKAIDGRVAD